MDNGERQKSRNADGEIVQRLFLSVFLSTPDAQYVLSLFSTVRQCFSNVFRVVVRFVVSMGSDVDSQEPMKPPLVDESKQ
jgi:hypothetical protein